MKTNLTFVKSEQISLPANTQEREDKCVQTDITYSPLSSTSNSPNRSYSNASFIERIAKELFKVKDNLENQKTPQ
jgi:hypothetical protein